MLYATTKKESAKLTTPIKEWKCPNCNWVEKAHPDYGWQSHNQRAIEVHRQHLCPGKPKKIPTGAQKGLIEAIAQLVNASLYTWPRGSGKTTLRQMLAERILEDDD